MYKGALIYYRKGFAMTVFLFLIQTAGAAVSREG
jgi:hypothetical protein